MDRKIIPISGSLVIGITCIIFLLMGVGCAMMSAHLVPAERDYLAEEYVIDAEIGIDPCEFKPMFFNSLADVIRLDKYLDYGFETNQLRFHHFIEADELTYGFLRKRVTNNLNQARTRQEAIFGDKGYLSTLMGLAGLGAGWTLLTKPGDKKKES